MLPHAPEVNPFYEFVLIENGEFTSRDRPVAVPRSRRSGMTPAKLDEQLTTLIEYHRELLENPPPAVVVPPTAGSFRRGLLRRESSGSSKAEKADEAPPLALITAPHRAARAEEAAFITAVEEDEDEGAAAKADHTSLDAQFASQRLSAASDAQGSGGGQSPSSVEARRQGVAERPKGRDGKAVRPASAIVRRAVAGEDPLQ